MRRVLIFFIFGICVLGLKTISAQTTVQIGSGTSNSTYNVAYGLYNYSWGAQIYLSSEIGMAGEITQISFEFSGYTTTYNYNSQTIKIGHVVQSEFDASPSVDLSDLTISNLTTVKGNFTNSITSNTWIDFTLTSSSFIYDGTSNLIIIWENNDGSWSSGYGVCEGHSSTNRVAYKYLDASYPTGTGTRSSTRPNVKLLVSTCTPPTTAASSLSTAYVSTTSASVTYTAPSTGDEIIVVCRPTAASATDPTDGNDYAAASLDYSAAPALGSGKVVFSGANTSATKTVTNLDCTTNYSFDIYSRQSDGDCYYATQASTDYTAKRLCSITYSQPSTADVSPGNTDIALIRADISVGGSTGSLPLSSLQVTSAGTADADIDAASVKLYRTTTTTFATTNQLGSAQSLSGGTATFNSGTDIPYDFPNGTTYLWVAVNVAAAAEIGNELDLLINTNHLTINAVTYPASSQNPAGVRTILGNPNGLVIAGNIINNGTWEQYASNGTSSPTAYTKLSGASKSITGTGTYTQVWLQFEESTTFDGAITGEVEKTLITADGSMDVATTKTYRTGEFKNLGVASFLGTSEVRVSGDFTNSGTINANSSTVTFVGGSAQNATSDGATLYNVTMSGAGGVTLTDNMTIGGAATFTTGIMNTTATDLLILNDNATTSGASNTSHVNGPCKKIGNDDFVFPVGANGSLRPIGISSVAGNTQEYTAQVYHEAHSNYTDVESPITQISTIWNWDLDQTGGTDDAIVELFWSNATGDGVNDCDDITVGHYYNGVSGWKWYEEGAVTVTGSLCSGTDDGSVKTSAEVAQYSRFALASKNAGTNPLPLTLVKFHGAALPEFNELRWTTASEIGVSHFVIESSTEPQNFHSIGVVPASGNSNQNQQYTLVDHEFGRENYYRLRSVDFDGTEYLSQVVRIQRTGVSKTALSLFPNPTQESVTIYLSGLTAPRVRLIDAAGRVLTDKQQDADSGMSFTIDTSELPAGVYSVQAIGSDGVTITQQLVKQ